MASFSNGCFWLICGYLLHFHSGASVVSCLLHFKILSSFVNFNFNAQARIYWSKVQNRVKIDLRSLWSKPGHTCHWMEDKKTKLIRIPSLIRRQELNLRRNEKWISKQTCLEKSFALFWSGYYSPKAGLKTQSNFVL